MSPTVGKMRGFLLQHPKPTVIRLTTPEGQSEEIKVGK